MSTARALSAREYAELPQVVARARDFCGLAPWQRSRCVYVAGMATNDGPHVTWGDVVVRPPECLTDLLVKGADVTRSLWDTASLLVYVDIDYFNVDAPGDAFLHPADAFLKLEPTYRAFRDVIAELGAPMLDLVTGRGYSFVGRVPLEGATASRLASLARDVPSWHATHAQRRPEWAQARIDANHAMAFHGLGLVLEYLVHRVLERAARETAIPVVMNNTIVGAGPRGREFVSIDLSHMGDPLDARHLRVPFGLYRRHLFRPDLVGPVAARLPPLVVVPRERRPLLDVLEGGREPRQAAEQARGARTDIPDVERGMQRLLDDYSASDLASWHRDFHDTPHAGTPTIDPRELPPCVAACLEWPNDLLLEPTRVQMLVRALLARGWHARAISDLVVAQYTRGNLWGDHWRRADPATRAEFDVRVFAGLVATGHDEGVDMNCVSTQEKGLCPGGGCAFDLRSERGRMLARARS